MILSFYSSFLVGEEDIGMKAILNTAQSVTLYSMFLPRNFV